MATRFVLFAILGIFAFFSGCNSAETTETLPSHSIVSDDEFGIGKNSREVAVLLQEPLSEKELTAIANKIRDSKRKSYERMNTHFYLPGMKPADGAWATAKFNPEIRVQIFGNMKNEED